MKMIKGKYMLAFSLFAVLLCGCDKEKKDTPTIMFAMKGVGAEATTRAALTDQTISGRPIYVYGTRTYASSTTNVFSGTKVVNYPNGFWYAETSSNDRDWNSGSYSFRAVASSADISPVATASYTNVTPPATPGITVFNSGLSFWANQPKDYTGGEASMIDYLLSRRTTVADGTTRPLVELHMEHSMPAVEFYVIKAEAMYEACLESITFSGIYSSVRMTCSSPSDINSTELNSWSVTPLGNKDASYTINGTLESKIQITDDVASTSAKMKLITVPQKLTKDAILTINYLINERSASSSSDNYVPYTASFLLYEKNIIEWLPGHRIIYTLKVDSGIHLFGTIVPWRLVDYIEGTILPDVPGTE